VDHDPGAAAGAHATGDEELARGFCDVVLPAILADLGPLCATVNAVVQVWVKSDVEDLARVVRLDHQPSVAAGEDPDADLHLAVHARALPALLLGTLDAGRALLDRDVELEGDVDVLARWAALLHAGASPLATRLCATTTTSRGEP
jgi:predicted lipid carrier protein YhbT